MIYFHFSEDENEVKELAQGYRTIKGYGQDSDSKFMYPSICYHSFYVRHFLRASKNLGSGTDPKPQVNLKILNKQINKFKNINRLSCLGFLVILNCIYNHWTCAGRCTCMHMRTHTHTHPPRTFTP